MSRLILPLVALLASTSLAAAAPEKMTESQLDQVVAGWDGAGCDHSPFLCGNNGWGNGWDPINPGSDAGGTEPSKMNNGTILGFGQINIDPVSPNNTALLGR
jgi:hypothetical protein